MTTDLHGRTKYINDKCRCPTCRAANTQYMRAWRANKAPRTDTPEVAPVIPPSPTPSPAADTTIEAPRSILHPTQRR